MTPQREPESAEVPVFKRPDSDQRKIDLVPTWKLDRAFRSLLHASTTLEEFRRWGVSLRSYTEPWADTTSPQGELVFNLLATFAQFERSLIAERVRAGMERARRQSKHIGRPRAVNGEWARVQPLVADGFLSQRAAARELGVGRSTIARMLAHDRRAQMAEKVISARATRDG